LGCWSISSNFFIFFGHHNNKCVYTTHSSFTIVVREQNKEILHTQCEAKI
jgi:hypothetical protein